MKKNIRKIFESLSISFFVFGAFTVTPIFIADSVVSTGKSYAAEEERRAPPAARSSGTLSRRVSGIIFDVMEFRDVEDYVSATAELDKLREMHDDDRLNDKEESTMWQFYASLSQAQEKYSETIGYMQEMLNMGEALTPEQLETTIKSIATLNYFLERYEEAIEYYIRYNEIAVEADAAIYLNIASAYYQLERYNDSLPYLLRNMELVREGGEEVKESTYNILRAIYFSLDDFESALQVIREMVVLFNDIDNWPLLAGIEGQLERLEDQGNTYAVANIMGYLDAGSQLRNLASHFYNSDNPYGAALILEQGLEAGLLEEDESILGFLSQCYQTAREDELAIVPLRKAAEISEDGENYIRLGVIYSNIANYESAIESFDLAIEKGDLKRVDQVQIRRARAFLQLDRYDEGIVAAREAGKDERSKSTADTWSSLLEREKRKYDAKEANRILYEGYFR